METQVYVDPQDAETNKIISILAYAPFLFLIPLLTAKDSKFAKFHANQGLLLTIVSVALWIVQWIIRSIYWASIRNNPWRVFTGSGGFLLTIVSIVVWGVIGVLALLGVMAAYKGECKPLPLIGQINLINK